VGAKDSLLYTHALTDIAALKEPYLAVLHLSNTHYPYRFPDADAPFQPESDQTGPYYKVELTNRYKDAVYHQDRGLAEFVRGLRARPEGSRTVIVFISDHAEQLHEHGAHGHTGTLFDTEIRVPAWIDAPPGTITDEERKTMASLKNVPLTTLDVFPTLMDLMGLWNGQDLGSYRTKMTGQSLLRGGSSPTIPHVLTNCSGLWACAFKNWGAMRGNRKVFAMQGDQGWRCFDTDFDPTELKTLPLEDCADLVPLAETLGRPFQ
jgi:arylsulfatase A-like enzyme